MTGGELKEKRKALGLNQTQLAELLEVDIMTISRYETGKRDIPNVFKLALDTVEREHGKKKGSKK
jgi:transcriptional regulator with XRE-family HTH domain